MFKLASEDDIRICKTNVISEGLRAELADRKRAKQHKDQVEQKAIHQSVVGLHRVNG